jgi:hypothetical protein
MIEDLYHVAKQRLIRHLQEAGMDCAEDDGDLLVAGHRLGLSITFEGFTREQEQTIAPVDIQIHLDGDWGDRFRVGTLGVGNDRTTALNAAVEEWYLLAAAPVVAALGAATHGRLKPEKLQKFGAWELFPGQAGIRGAAPFDSASGAAFYRELFARLRKLAASWAKPPRFELRSVYMLVTQAEGNFELQAAVDGYINEKLSASLANLPWPKSGPAYLYKQLFVFRAE